jgi:hypothetical protein
MIDNICDMKKQLTVLACATVIVAASAAGLSAQDLKGWNEVSVGARRHTLNSVFGDLPFKNGDYSYGVAWQYHEDDVFFELGVDYSPDVDGTDFVITPRLNLIGTDNIFGARGTEGFWRGGIGICDTYNHPKTGEADWTGYYWQFLLGIRIPISSVGLEARTYYVFKRWSELNQFDAGDLEFGLSLSLPF